MPKLRKASEVSFRGELAGIEEIRGDMGWSSFGERLYKGKLKFNVRLENMDGNRWARIMYIESG